MQRHAPSHPEFRREDTKVRTPSGEALASPTGRHRSSQLMPHRKRADNAISHLHPIGCTDKVVSSAKRVGVESFFATCVDHRHHSQWNVVARANLCDCETGERRGCNAAAFHGCVVIRFSATGATEMSDSLNAGISAGMRAVTRFPSDTLSLSI